MLSEVFVCVVMIMCDGGIFDEYKFVIEEEIKYDREYAFGEFEKATR